MSSKPNDLVLRSAAECVNPDCRLFGLPQHLTAVNAMHFCREPQCTLCEQPLAVDMTAGSQNVGNSDRPNP